MRTKNRQYKPAFTVVELIVVIVVIAILATISVVSYRIWQDTAAETEIKSDLSSIQTAMNDRKNWTSGADSGYPVFEEGTVFDGTNDTKKIFTQSPGVTLTYMSGDKKSFCVEAVSKLRSKVYLYLESTDGIMKKGTCAGGEGAVPVPTGAGYTLFTFDLNAPSCNGSTIQLPIATPTADTNSEIHWGDGATETRTAILPSHTYSKKARYTVAYKGLITGVNGNSITATNRNCLTGIKQWGTHASPTQLSLPGGANLTYIAKPPISVTDMSSLFEDAATFNQNISGWDVSEVTNMGSMFRGASTFNQNISGWNVSNVTNMQSVFYNASAFNQAIGGWNVSKVTSMEQMFYGARAFNQNIASWNTSGVTSMGLMFRGASAFNQAIGGWNVSKVTSMRQMFYDASAFNQPIGGWNVGEVTDMAEMFRAVDSSMTFNQPIGSWNVGKVTNMYLMFGTMSSKTSAFNQPIGSWNVSNVTNMSYMFDYSTTFNQPIGGWNVGKVTNMSYMFRGASAFNQNISGWDVGAVTSWTGFRASSSLLATANTPPKFR